MTAEDGAGRTIATAAHDRAYIAVGDRTITVGPLDDCRSLSVSPDGQWLATGSWGNGGATIWKLPVGTPALKLPFDGFCTVAFTPDGKRLTTNQGGTTRLWEVGTWREVLSIDGDYSEASSDGKLAVFRDSSRSGFSLVEFPSGRTLARFESPDQHQVGSIMLSPDGARLIVVSLDSPTCVHVWDLRVIRHRLAEMGLDWNAPAYPQQDLALADLPQLPPLELDFGPLAEYLAQ
jgi:WD40 repeat protein